MTDTTRSERILTALSQLEQFLPVQGEENVVCALTGVRVTALPDLDESDRGMLQLTFPGGAPTR